MTGKKMKEKKKKEEGVTGVRKARVRNINRTTMKKKKKEKLNAKKKKKRGGDTERIVEVSTEDILSEEKRDRKKG